MKPKKLWRVKLTGCDVTGTSAFTSEKKTYEFVCAMFGEEEALITEARVEQWTDDRWCHFETLTRDDFSHLKDVDR